MKINEFVSKSDLNWEDRIIFLEEYYTKNGDLTESNSESVLKHFEMLLDGTVNPVVGMKYIVMSLMLVKDKILPFEGPIVGKCFSINSKEMKFINLADEQMKTFPPLITRRVVSTTATFVFDSVDEYGKVETYLNLKWDLVLPDIDKSLLENQHQPILLTNREIPTKINGLIVKSSLDYLVPSSNPEDRNYL